MAGPDELTTLARRRFRVAMVLTAAMLATYFGFLLLVAYDKPLLGALVLPGLSWGILLGALVIVVAWALTGVYVRWANRVYDVELARLRDSFAPAAAPAAEPSASAAPRAGEGT